MNPDHLEIGTGKDQARDMREHGTRKGVNPETAREIYEYKGSGKKAKEVAELYGVSGGIVSNIWNKVSHKYLHE